MSSIPCIVARLSGGGRAGRAGLTAALTAALSDEPCVAMRTRLGLVALASRIEAGEFERVSLAVDGLPEALRAAEAGDDAGTVAALLACRPALHAAAGALARRGAAFAPVPQALLQWLASRLH